MKIRIPRIWLAAALLAAGVHSAAAAETLLATVSRANTSSHHLCNYNGPTICTFQAAGLVWKLVNQDGNIYIFSHTPKRPSLRFMGVRSLNALRSGHTVITESSTYTIRMTPMWAVNQLF